jgi:hypothetical protein
VNRARIGSYIIKRCLDRSITPPKSSATPPRGGGNDANFGGQERNGEEEKFTPLRAGKGQWESAGHQNSWSKPPPVHNYRAYTKSDTENVSEAPKRSPRLDE